MIRTFAISNLFQDKNLTLCKKNISLKLLPSEAANEQAIKQYIAGAEAMDATDVSGYTITQTIH